jgi:hypothetical protein
MKMLCAFCKHARPEAGVVFSARPDIVREFCSRSCLLLWLMRDLKVNFTLDVQ